MERASIGKLPDETVRDICEYLRVESTPDKNERNVQTDIRALLDTCQRIRELKLSEVGIWFLKREYAQQYKTEDAFRARVNEALSTPGRDGNPQQQQQQQQQLPIGMDLSNSSIVDVSATSSPMDF
jgi:hypothetical protein